MAPDWLARYREWRDGAPRWQYALVAGGSWFVMWLTLELVLGDQDLPSAVALAALGAAVFGGVNYAWDPR